mmetsp:Transcript_10391/g.25984  ORF Transcript_10391/g.25984 Transcript_10391/m.25984 type:complete len:220 (+) Transcript_10391:3-662(+)
MPSARAAAVAAAAAAERLQLPPEDAVPQPPSPACRGPHPAAIPTPLAEAVARAPKIGETGGMTDGAMDAIGTADAPKTEAAGSTVAAAGFSVAAGLLLAATAAEGRDEAECAETSMASQGCAPWAVAQWLRARAWSSIRRPQIEHRQRTPVGAATIAAPLLPEPLQPPEPSDGGPIEEVAAGENPIEAFSRDGAAPSAWPTATTADGGIALRARSVRRG